MTLLLLLRSAAASGAETGTLSASVPLVTGTISGTAAGPVFTGTLSASVPRATSSISGTAAGPVFTGTFSASTPLLTASIAGTVTAPSWTGTLSAATPKTTGSIAGTVTAPSWTGTLAAAVPLATSSIPGEIGPPAGGGTLGASVPLLTAAIDGTVAEAGGTGTLAASVPLATASIAGAVTGPLVPPVEPETGGGGAVDESAITGRSRRVETRTGHGYGWGSRSTVYVRSTRRLAPIKVKLPPRRPARESVNVEVESLAGVCAGVGSAAAIRVSHSATSVQGSAEGWGARSRVLVLSMREEDREDDPVALALLGVF